MEVKEAVQDQLKVLRDRYWLALPAKIQQIDTLWEQLKATTTSADSFRSMIRFSHNLAGSGATFGFKAISDAARELENFTERFSETSKDLTAEQREQGDALVRALHAAANVNDTGADTINIIRDQEAQEQQSSNLIYLVEDDEELARELSYQIGHFGYEVVTICGLGALRDAVTQRWPRVIVMDIVFPQGRLAGAEMIAEIQASHDRPLEVMFISARDDLEARLQVVRAGGVAYHTKPIDIARFIDALDRLTTNEQQEPHRVLIVEDSRTLAEYYALALEQAGMSTKTLSEPMNLLETLKEFKPELILMDIYLPHCTGVELAAVIRQKDDYVGVPIVYLSTESNIEKQLSAMHLKADDFLTKPIETNHLVSSVSNRAARYRVLRSLMMRDGLTGLLNHSTIKNNLIAEVARAGREHQQFTFSMIDIDHFKVINDTFGHGAGDRVIKSLARLLRQRLRRSDIVGRYGGEEFAVILPNTNGETAKRVLEDIRNTFSQLQFLTDNREFCVTFSCGIATYPQSLEANQLAETADRALYVAKNEGRNRTVLGTD